MLRRALIMLVVGLLSACVNGNDFDEPAVDLGDFSLGHNVVVAPNVTKGPVSREASDDMLKDAVRGAIAERFDRYEGDRQYHFGVSIEGYVLAQPGVPVLLSPKSLMIVRLTVWDDALGKKLNEEAKQLTIVEEISGGNIIGSGLTKTGDEQLTAIARGVAKSIENYLVEQKNERGWFTGNVLSEEEVQAARAAKAAAAENE